MASFWILVSILILLIIFAIISYWLYKKKKRPIDYYNLFLIGIVWMPIGLATENWVLGIIGTIFVILGLVNKKKWKANKANWKGLSKNQKILRIILMVILLLLLIASFIILLVGKTPLI